MDLQGFTAIDACATVAPPGLVKIEYAAIDGIEVASVEPDALSSTYNQQREITFSSGSWQVLPAAFGTAEWQEDLQDNPQGPFFRVSVSARIAGDSPAVRGELNRMKQHRYILRVTGRDATPMLIGSLEQPLQFESRFESGADGSDSRGHRCSFSGVNVIASPAYIPVF